MKKIISCLIILNLIGCKKNAQNESKSIFDFQNTFTCENPDLTKGIEEKVGPIESIITIDKNDDLKTCTCESYAPTLRYQTGEYHEGPYHSIVPNFSTGKQIKYTAQLKEDGEIAFHIEY